MRPINQKPSWLETILLRPIRVECWACLHFAWLDRNQRGVSPSDWTCPNCLTHQRRDKDGNIIPVPEMYDGTLNEETADRVGRSLKHRKKPNSRVDSKPLENDFFCEMCNGHQRVVYQLLSNYIPDEEDENYDAYYQNADIYRRQLEERYPLACSKCLDKVQKELSQQNYRIKSSLLNATLNKSRGDRISATRKYPTVKWIATGFSWICVHGALLGVEIVDCFGPDALPNFRILKLPKYLAQSAGSLSLRNAAGVISKLNSSAIIPWSKTFGNPFLNLNGGEQSTIALVTLICLSISGLYWDPLDFAIQRAQRKKIRVRQFYSWVRASAIPFYILEYVLLFSGRWRLDISWGYGALLLLHIVYIVAFFNGRYIQEPNEVKFDSSASSITSSNPSTCNNTSQDDKRKSPAKNTNAPAASSRTAAQSYDNFFASSSRSPEHIPRSHTSSPEINEINWSPKKPSNSMSPAFGMYRDPNQPTRQNDNLLRSSSQSGNAGSFQEQQSFAPSGFGHSSDNKFRSRAYEPSPLANPSLVTNMGLSNMSLGEMFGFPSAKFQPPENHFAHRTANRQETGVSDAWSYRKTTDGSGANGTSRISTHHPRFSQDFDMDDDDDEDSQKLASLSRRSGRPTMNADTHRTEDMFSSFGLGSTPTRSTGDSTTNSRELFAAQRYFPPEPETGLEDNFFGIVKIVDDYLPPQQGPRSIAGRNLMLKKRMAQRWLGVLVICRSIVLWSTQSGGSILDSFCQVVFAAMILHATAFWLLDEYRLLKRQLGQKNTSLDKKKASNDIDPFEPTTIDRVCSYLLFLMLTVRLINIMSRILVENVLFGNPSISNDTCLSPTVPGWRCPPSSTDRFNLMDWSPTVIQLIYPGVEGYETLKTLAFYSGWVHDIAIAILLALLMSFGAGSLLLKTGSSPVQDKIKRRGD